jgi:hypothetical protein
MPRHSGTLHVTWAVCPNKECQSRDWDAWDVDYDHDKFKCGTCGMKLSKPIFLCPLLAEGTKCPLRKKEA